MFPPEILPYFESGMKALQTQHYKEAIKLLIQVCKKAPDKQSSEYIQAQMGLVRAYRGIGDIDRAASLCETLEKQGNDEVKRWARSMTMILRKNEYASEANDTNSDGVLSSTLKASRADSRSVAVSLPRVADSFWFTVFSSLLFSIFTTSVIVSVPLAIVGLREWELLRYALGFGVIITALGIFYSQSVIQLLLERFFDVT